LNPPPPNRQPNNSRLLRTQNRVFGCLGDAEFHHALGGNLDGFTGCRAMPAPGPMTDTLIVEASQQGLGTMQRCRYFFTWPETSFVISNMLTCFFPLKTAFRFSSALMRVFFFASCNPFLRM